MHSGEIFHGTWYISKEMAGEVHSVGVFMLISRAKVRPGAAGSDYSECSDWLLQIAALIRYAPNAEGRASTRCICMYLAVLAGIRISTWNMHSLYGSLISSRKRDFDRPQ